MTDPWDIDPWDHEERVHAVGRTNHPGAVAPDCEEALRLARGWEAKPLPTEKITPEGIGIVARALLALAADLEAAERKAKELGRLADDEGSRRMAAKRERDNLKGHIDFLKSSQRERDLATAREALEQIAEWPHRIKSGSEDGTAPAIIHDWAVAALRSLGEKE